MTEIKVWAPKAEAMEIQGPQGRSAMTRTEYGWWKAAADSVAYNEDYGFIINGNGPYPDPRSNWQPQGIHGLSRRLDHATFAWQDSAWQPPPIASAILYELHIGTFTPAGTFKAAIDKLEYLKSIGVTHIEIMPVNEYSGVHGWGYDGVDLYAPHHHYGEPDDLKALVNQCHRLGIAVILDVVYNHLGPAGNYLSQFGPYFTDLYQTPWGEAVNLDDAHSLEVRRFFVDNALMWLNDYHFDGLRIDAVHAFMDRSAVHWLEQLMHEVRQLETRIGRPLLIIAESDLNDPRIIQPATIGGYGGDAQWNEDFHHAVYTLVSEERQGYYTDFGLLSDLAHVLQRGFCYAGRYSQYRKRMHGKSAAGIAGRKFIAFIQNHDQVGNRATGDRINQAVTPAGQKLAAAILLTSPFVPMLFQGEEWASSSPFLYFTSHQDTQLGKAVSKGRTQEFAAFGWELSAIPDPQNPDTFQRSKLHWEELQQPQHQDMLQWYRNLIALRAKYPELTDANLSRVKIQFDEQARWMSIRRGRIVVAINFSKRRQTLRLPADAETSALMTSDQALDVKADGISLSALSIAVFLCGSEQ